MNPADGSTIAGARSRIGWLARVMSVRLRFPILLVMIVGIVAQWENISTRANRLIDLAFGVKKPDTAVSPDTEFFCPMDPGVLADWPSKCPICNMTLVRRKRGDVAPLPDGVVARMQLSPYRIQLAGVTTVPVEYRPLAIERLAWGNVTESATTASPVARILTRLSSSQAEEIAPGLVADVYVTSNDHLSAKVVSAGASSSGINSEREIRLEVLDEARRLNIGDNVRVAFSIPAANLPGFRNQPRNPSPPPQDAKSRIFQCPDHLEVVQEKPGQCPIDRLDLPVVRLAANQRVGYWCPMHPRVSAEAPGARCEECGGMELVPRVINYAPPGEVLSVPESAVIDTGSRKIVYVERMPGMVDGVEVQLGPRCGDAYPVLSGLQQGQRVARSGAFLLDAETRLNPGVATAYFGAARPASDVPHAVHPLGDQQASTSDSLTIDPRDLEQIVRQGTCPVTDKTLGSMGAPLRIVVQGRTVFLCCAGCKPTIEAESAKYLAKLPSTSGRAKGAP
jgi:membrane fusion protein, copper/silver efflux system